jgi:hypothetical protein
MKTFQKPCLPFLYNSNTGDMCGFKDPDGSEQFFAFAPRLGFFYSTQDQTDGGATPLTFNNSAVSRGVSIVGGSEVVVDRSGLYMFQLSMQIENADSGYHSFNMWGLLNDEIIENSNFRYSVPPAHGGAPGRLAPSQNFMLALNAGDRVEMHWYTNDEENVTLATIAAQSNPTRPATPSILLTVQEVGGLEA